MKTPIEHYCLNCHYPVEYNYCPNCGQSIQVQKIDSKFIKHELQHGIFHFDNAFVFTLLQLFQQPGLVVKNYIKGKRKPYASPFTLFVFLATIYTLLSVHYSAEESVKMEINGKVAPIVTYLITHYTWFVLFVLPIISLITYVLFKKSNYNYHEIVVYECFIQSKIVVVHFLFLLIHQYVSPASIWQWIAVVLVAVITVRAKLLFFSQYALPGLLVRAGLSILLNWVAIVFFLFVVALCAYALSVLLCLPLV